MTDFDPNRPRSFYEAEGRQRREAGEGISCSEPSITEVVMTMLGEFDREFTSILDVGCGANLTYDLPLAARGKQVTGIEFARSFLAMTPPHPGVTLVQADATLLPFRSASFEAVVCSETVEHIPDDRKTVEEIARVLRPRGLLFFTVPNLLNAARLIDMARRRTLTVSMMEGHLREYSPGSVRRLLSGRFEILRSYPVGFGWSGRRGTWIERAIRSRLLQRVSKSIAVVARRKD